MQVKLFQLAGEQKMRSLTKKIATIKELIPIFARR